MVVSSQFVVKKERKKDTQLEVKMRSNVVFCMVSVMLVALWRGAQALPLTTSTTQALLRDFDVHNCRIQAKAVLSHISALLNNTELFHGFNCSEMSGNAPNKTSTVSACAPISGATCLVGQKTSFNETDCVVNIKADMEYYKKVLQDYPHPHPDITKVVKATTDMQEHCKWTASDSDKASEKPCDTEQGFGQRVCLCKLVHGFQLRAVTINRALGYIASGEHRK